MKKTIRLTESDLHKIIKESVRRIIKETDCAGAMQTGCGEGTPKGSNPEAGQYTVPFGADKETADRTPGFSVQRRDIYNPKSGKKRKK